MRDWDSSPGEIVFQRHYNDPRYDNNPIEILQADPVVIADRNFIEEILSKDLPWVELQDNEFIKFTGRNRTVIYRIGEYNFMYDAYMLRWPD